MDQDCAYWGLREIDGIVRAWPALSAATQESGCIDVAKGSHKNPISPHQDSFDELNLLLRGQSRQKYGVLATRKLSLHHRLMIHCYGPNISDGHRIDVVIRYISPHTQSLITRAAMASPCAVNVTQEISISAHHQRACSTQIILYSMRKFETVKQRS